MFDNHLRFWGTYAKNSCIVQNLYCKQEVKGLYIIFKKPNCSIREWRMIYSKYPTAILE